MIRLAGRYNVPLADAWAMTPGEFEDLIAGRIEGEREMRFGFALVYSAVAALGGHGISPLVIIGEEEDHGPSPFGELSPKEKRARAMQQARERALAAAKDYLPEGYSEE